MGYDVSFESPSVFAAGFLLVIVRPLLTAATAYAATKTTELKVHWMTNTHWISRSGWFTRILILILVSVETLYCICIANGWLGFKKIPSGREAIIVGEVLSLILVPIVSLQVLGRLDYSLNKTRVFNRSELRVMNGIRNPRTIHGQEIPVHYEEVPEKSQLLFEAQQFQVILNADETGFDVDEIREDYAGPDCFAVGMVSGRKDPVTVRQFLMYGFRLRGWGLCRLVFGITLIISACLLQVFSPFETDPGSTSIFLFSFSWVLRALSIVALQMFYNRWAVDLTTPSLDRRRKALIFMTWTAAYLFVFAYAIRAQTAGIFQFHSTRSTRSQFGLFSLSQVMNVWANEAWIGLQTEEVPSFTVPSWTDLIARERPASHKFRKLTTDEVPSRRASVASIRTSIDAMNIARHKARYASHADVGPDDML